MACRNIKRITIIFLLLVLSSSINSCSLPKSWDFHFWEPRPFWGTRNFPESDTSYGRGFKQGCVLGWASTGKGWIGEGLKKELDMEALVNDPEYAMGQWDGYEQCVYILDWDVI